MRAALFLACLALPAAPLRIAAVERRGWPPFEDDRRIYRLAGEDAARLRPGELLQLHRSGDPRDPGRLKVAGVDAAGAIATLETRGSTYPLVGDEARSRRAGPLPGFPPAPALPELGPPLNLAPPAAETVPAPVLPADPPVPRALPAARREPIFFLEGDASLSPKGREKLQRVVREWGAGGRWVLALPEDRVLPEKVRQARIQVLRRALAGLGAGRVEVREAPRPDRGSGDVVVVEKD